MKNNELAKLLADKKSKGKELMIQVSNTFKLFEELNHVKKELENKLFKKTPRFLNTTEKIIYYFNRIEGFTLEEIADVLSYAISYVLKISMFISRKIEKNREKISKKQNKN